MTELEGRVALAQVDLAKARLTAHAAFLLLRSYPSPRQEGALAAAVHDAERGAASLAHALAVQDVRAAEVKLAMAESALARSLS